MDNEKLNNILNNVSNIISDLESKDQDSGFTAFEKMDISEDDEWNDEEDDIVSANVEIVQNDETVGTVTLKNPVGRPPGTPASELQKDRVRAAAKEYQRKLKAGEVDPPETTAHGAYSYMQNCKIGKKKKHYLKYVSKERNKWIEELGGEENLSPIELSMLDEATRLLMYSTLVNAHIMKGETEITFTDENGEVKMHTALSRNYLSFVKSYISILKELQKISMGRPKKGKGRGDVASRLQNLYNK